MSAISYANAAGAEPVKPESEVVQETAKETVKETSPAPAKTETKEPKEPKKVLAPAPVPEKNAWGASPAAATAAPAVVPFVAASAAGAKAPAKITNGKEKWVPFKASVVLPTPSSNNKSQGGAKSHNKSKSKKNAPASKDPKDVKPKSRTPKTATAPKKEESKEVKKDEAEKAIKPETSNETKEKADSEEPQTATQQPQKPQTQTSSTTLQTQPQQQQQPQHTQHRNYKGSEFQPRQGGFKKFNRHHNNSNGHHHHHSHHGSFHHNGPNGFGGFIPQPFVPANGFMRYPAIPPQFMMPPQPQQQFMQADPLTVLSRQIDYYFSIDNMVKDFYLRKQMNSQGYVPLIKIANFNRVLALSGGDFNMLLNALPLCQNLEVVGSDNIKLRTKFSWEQWVLPLEQREEAGRDESVPEPAAAKVDEESNDNTTN